MTTVRPEDGPPTDVLTLTSVIDSRAHKVADSELCAPHAVQAGRFEALCGHLVTPTAMVEAHGAPCARCAQLVPAVEQVPSRRRRLRCPLMRRLVT